MEHNVQCETVNRPHILAKRAFPGSYSRFTLTIPKKNGENTDKTVSVFHRFQCLNLQHIPQTQ